MSMVKIIQSRIAYISIEEALRFVPLRRAPATRSESMSGSQCTSLSVRRFKRVTSPLKKLSEDASLIIWYLYDME